MRELWKSWRSMNLVHKAIAFLLTTIKIHNRNLDVDEPNSTREAGKIVRKGLLSIVIMKKIRMYCQVISSLNQRHNFQQFLKNFCLFFENIMYVYLVKDCVTQNCSQSNQALLCITKIGNLCKETER